MGLGYAVTGVLCLRALWLSQFYASSGESEVPGFFEGARSRDLVEPLTKDELPPFNFMKWLHWSGSPPSHACAFTQLRPQTM